MAILLILEGTGIMLFAKAGSLPMAVASMLLFALFLKMANGGTYSIVPFINKQAMGSVAGIVGAGGNLGAMLVAFLFKSTEITYSQAFYFIGIGVLIIGIAVISVNMNAADVAEITVSNEGEELQRA